MAIESRQAELVDDLKQMTLCVDYNEVADYIESLEGGVL